MMRLFVFVFALISMANCDNLSFTTKYKEISSVVSTVGQIPCSINAQDDVAMILWFKDSAGAPLYSYDARNEKEEPRHLTLKNDYGLRLYFRVWPSSKRSPALMIRDLQPSDSGLYRCRVDYRNSPTSNSVIRLKIIEPPTHLEIRDTSRFRPISDQQMVSASQHSSPTLNDITYLGPYIEGQNATIVCSAYGGKPLPAVTWFRNGVMVDSSFEMVGNNYATNELSITNLGRDHSQDLYTCQASNNNETKLEHLVNLDVYLGVKHIELEIPDQMTAGASYNIVCKTAGAYPTVKMEFWKMQRRLGPKYQIKSDADNITSYTLPFKPEVQDDDSIIMCKADNPWLSEKPLVSRKSLKIKYTPVAILRFGGNKTTNFSEGESVLFECHVKANPPIRSIMWFHQDKQLFDNRTAGVQINGMTLVLRHLTHLSGGNYNCEAANDVGKGISNALPILLNISPKCASPEARRVPLSVGESHQLACNVLAWPSDLNFYWTLNRSRDILPIGTPNENSLMVNDGESEANSMNGDADLHFDSDSESHLLESPSRAKEFGEVVLLEGVGAVEKTARTRSTTSMTLTGSTVRSTDTSTRTTDAGSSPNNNSHYPALRGLNVSVTGVEMETNGAKRRDAQQSDFDKIRHQSLLSYKISSVDDYGTVACWARNSYGKQILPCLFHIITREEANLEERSDNPTHGRNLTFSSTSNNNSSSHMEQGSSVVGEALAFLSKLQGTYSIILMVVLIFMASFCVYHCYSRRMASRSLSLRSTLQQPLASCLQQSHRTHEQLGGGSSSSGSENCTNSTWASTLGKGCTPLITSSSSTSSVMKKASSATMNDFYGPSSSASIISNTNTMSTSLTLETDEGLHDPSENAVEKYSVDNNDKEKFGGKCITTFHVVPVGAILLREDCSGTGGNCRSAESNSNGESGRSTICPGENSDSYSCFRPDDNDNGQGDKDLAVVALLES